MKSIKYDEEKMKMEKMKGGYVAAVVKTPHKYLGEKFKSSINKHSYEVSIDVEKVLVSFGRCNRKCFFFKGFLYTAVPRYFDFVNCVHFYSNFISILLSCC